MVSWPFLVTYLTGTLILCLRQLANVFVQRFALIQGNLEDYLFQSKYRQYDKDLVGKKLTVEQRFVLVRRPGRGWKMLLRGFRNIAVRFESEGA